MGIGKALGKNELGKSDALALEQHMDIARRHALAVRDSGDRKTMRRQIGAEVGLDCLEPCCARRGRIKAILRYDAPAWGRYPLRTVHRRGEPWIHGGPTHT